MNRILDIQKKAEELRQQHRQAIEQQLQSDIQQAVNDTTRCLQQRVSTINNDIDRSHSEILSHQSEATTALLQQIEQNTAKIKAQQQQGMTALLQQQQQQIEQLQANLQQLNDLSQDIEQAASIKKTLTRSNTALILLACTMLISSICLGYVSKSKYNEIQVKKERLQQIEYQTQQKIAEYSKITTDLYKARGGR
jgi:preprotein translocase subunit SecG